MDRDTGRVGSRVYSCRRRGTRVEQAAAEIIAGQMALSDGGTTGRRTQERQSREDECFKARLVTGGTVLLQRAQILEKQDRQPCGHCEEAQCMRQSLPPHQRHCTSQPHTATALEQRVTKGY